MFNSYNEERVHVSLQKLHRNLMQHLFFIFKRHFSALINLIYVCFVVLIRSVGLEAQGLLLERLNKKVNFTFST